VSENERDQLTSWRVPETPLPNEFVVALDGGWITLDLQQVECSEDGDLNVDHYTVRPIGPDGWAVRERLGWEATADDLADALVEAGLPSEQGLPLARRLLAEGLEREQERINLMSEPADSPSLSFLDEVWMTLAILGLPVLALIGAAFLLWELVTWLA
jgi:hypothetical protein